MHLSSFCPVTLSLTWPRLSSSTWGESLFITVQLVVLVILIMAYNKQTLFMVPVMLAVGAMFYALLTPGVFSRLKTCPAAKHIPSDLDAQPSARGLSSPTHLRAQSWSMKSCTPHSRA